MIFFSFPQIRISTTILLLSLLPTLVSSSPNVSLSKTVPNCAFSCAERFLEFQFPTSDCPNRSNTDCFCKTKTKSGYTLGEGILQCMLSHCSKDVVAESSDDVYGICDGLKGAVSKTHAAITATMAPGASPTAVSGDTKTPAVSSSGTTASGTETSVTSPVLTTFQSPLSTTGSEGVAPTTITATESQSQSPSSTPEENGGGDSSSLSAGAVVGVSVASGLSGSFFVGVAIFFWWRKMRRKRKQADDAHYFEIGGRMSEPPDFDTPPPRRPTPGPNSYRPQPPPKSPDRIPTTETSRLMSPFLPRPRPANPSPAVVVTDVDDEDHHDGGGFDEDPARLAHAMPPFVFDEVDTPRSISATQRTKSDQLLPDKPELLPEPLRWDRPRASRANSDAVTMFEEDIPRPKSHLFNGYPNFSGPLGPRLLKSKRPTAGLPANPRAMMYGFGSQDHLPLKRSQELLKPTYLQPEARPSSSVPATPGGCSRSSMSDDGYDDYYFHWQDYDANQPRPPARIANRRSYPSQSTGFDYGNLESHRTSRHSGSFKPLTPVREESRTPTRSLSNPNPQDRIGYSTGSPPERFYNPQTPKLDPAHEIVSRPRIVRQHDIKRVEIRRGKSREIHTPVMSPYSPDDYWNEPSRNSMSQVTTAGSSTLTTPTSLSIGAMPSVEKTITRKPAKRQSPLERNLTPSRVGADLILRVD